MTPHISAYFIPLLPLITRTVLCVLRRSTMNEHLPEEAQERDLQRTFILGLAGFSFTAVAGLAVLDSQVRIELQLATWFVLLSFLTFIFSLNLQSYKSTRLQNQIATAVLEIGTLSLMLALVALLCSASFDLIFQWIAVSVTLGLWSVDHVIRWVIEFNYLGERQSKLLGIGEK